MRDAFIQLLCKQVGFSHVPQSQQEFFQMVSDDKQFGKDMQKAEQMGILKRDANGTCNIIDMDKTKDIIQKFFMGMLK